MTKAEASSAASSLGESSSFFLFISCLYHNVMKAWWRLLNQGSIMPNNKQEMPSGNCVNMNVLTRAVNILHKYCANSAYITA